MFVFLWYTHAMKSSRRRFRETSLGGPRCGMSNVNALIATAHETDEPVIVYDGEDECLVAMRPAVFERILFDSDLLNQSNRSTLHF